MVSALRRSLLAAGAAMLLAGCQGFLDPRGNRNDRFVFPSPESAVLFVYQNLSAGRYEQMTLPMFEYTDKRPWLARAGEDNPHPWTTDENAEARIFRRDERADGRIELAVEEHWTGGETDRNFVCEETPDGWRIADIEGEPGDGMRGR